MGGSFENRTRILRKIVSAIRSVWPGRAPLFVRISATDWVEGGWDIEPSVELARQLKPLGVDLIDCSSGGNVPHARIPGGPLYQTLFAERIRREAGIFTGAVGMITTPDEADHNVAGGHADSSWRGNFCVIRIGLSGQPTNWDVRLPGPLPTSAPPRSFAGAHSRQGGSTRGRVRGTACSSG
jgi:NADH:flavin oxidoreductase/NADH oxidase family protein